jgi:DNA repair exonuclease SbcCD ATPase subunit
LYRYKQVLSSNSEEEQKVAFIDRRCSSTMLRVENTGVKHVFIEDPCAAVAHLHERLHRVIKLSDQRLQFETVKSRKWKLKCESLQMELQQAQQQLQQQQQQQQQRTAVQQDPAELQQAYERGFAAAQIEAQSIADTAKAFSEELLSQAQKLAADKNTALAAAQDAAAATAAAQAECTAAQQAAARSEAQLQLALQRGEQIEQLHKQQVCDLCLSCYTCMFAVHIFLQLLLTFRDDFIHSLHEYAITLSACVCATGAAAAGTANTLGSVAV